MKSKKIEFLHKTADAKFRIIGKDLEEAFELSAKATAQASYDPDKVQKKLKRKIEVQGKDKQALLYNFLEEILVLFETEFILLNEVKIIKIFKKESAYHLEAELAGDKNQKKYGVFGEVKAITYNEMKIDEFPGKVVIEAVLDL